MTPLQAQGHRARAALQALGVGWLGGMKLLGGRTERRLSVNPENGCAELAVDWFGSEYEPPGPEDLPDLSDPATLGAIEIGVLEPRGVYLMPAVVGNIGIFWSYVSLELSLNRHGTDTRAKAVLLALEALVKAGEE